MKSPYICYILLKVFDDQLITVAKNLQQKLELGLK